MSLLFKNRDLQTRSTYPMTLSNSESRPSLHVRFEELVGEVLCEEGKHQTGALRVWYKLSPH